MYEALDDAPIGTPHLDTEALAAWEKHCALVQRWVAEERLPPEAGILLCDARGMVGWVRAYLAERAGL